MPTPNETPVTSTLLMDRDGPLGNSQDVDTRRALHVKIKNTGSETIPIATSPFSISSGVYTGKNIGTSATLLSVSAGVLTSRRLVIVTPTTRDLYWGFDASVTTATGNLIQKNSTATFQLTDDTVTIYGISAANNNVRITEAILG